MDPAFLILATRRRTFIIVPAFVLAVVLDVEFIDVLLRFSLMVLVPSGPWVIL